MKNEGVKSKDFRNALWLVILVLFLVTVIVNLYYRVQFRDPSIEVTLMRSLVMFLVPLSSFPLLIWTSKKISLLEHWTHLFIHIFFSLVYVGLFTFTVQFILLGIEGYFIFDEKLDFIISMLSRQLIWSGSTSFLIYWGVAVLSGVDKYYNNVSSLIEKTNSLETQLSSARLATLKAQLKPHFLFNTLNMVDHLIHTDSAKAIDTISKLEELIKSTFDKSQPNTCTIREEVVFLEKYLEIEKARFSDRLSLNFDIDKETENIKIPSYLIQPLVENSIKHGVGKTLDECTIGLSAKFKGDFLAIEVADNASGFKKKPEKENWSIGLKNIDERLKLFFGKNAFLDLSAFETKGFRSSILIPKKYIRV